MAVPYVFQNIVVRPICFVIFKLFYKVKIKGLENLPLDKGLIFSSNHLSYLDGPFISWAANSRLRDYIRWVVDKRIFNLWYLKPILSMSGCVPINGCSKRVENVLKNAGYIGILPEGCVCSTKVIKKGHTGVAVLAHKTGAPIVPCFIDGVINPKRRFHIIPRIMGHYTLRFGKPLKFDKLDYDIIPRDILDETLSKIIKAINDLGNVKSSE